MKTAVIQIESKVDELLDVLDKDIEHLELSLIWLNELRSHVIKREDVSLSELLGNIKSEARDYSDNEIKRQSIRQELANSLGCKFEEMTLSNLATFLSEEKKSKVEEKRKQLRELALKLKNEHIGTMLLLSDCARFNRKLLNNIFDFKKTETVTYNSNGFTKRQADTNFVNLKF